MTDISETERLAFITREQVRLVNAQADIAEDEARAFSQDRARQRGTTLIIDWSTGQRAIFTDNVIPFERR